jgi:hypothetical protein
MVDFGGMNRHDEQQRVVIEKIRHADSLAENFDAASQDPKKHIVFCLAFLIAAEPDDAIKDNGATRLIAIEAALRQHKICQSTFLMELISARNQWWGTCHDHLKSEQCRFMD